MRPLAAYLLCLLAVWACQGEGSTVPKAGGNSGAEGQGQPSGPGLDPVSCPCNPPGRLARVVVLARDDAHVELRVDALIGSIPEVPLVPGDEIEARFLGRLPCYRGTTDVAAGQDALAIFHPGALIDEGRWSEVRLTPWRDELVLAQTDEAELTVSASEVARLIDRDQRECYEEYGNWDELAGAATDGTSDVHYCVSDGGDAPCADPGQDQ